MDIKKDGLKQLKMTYQDCLFFGYQFIEKGAVIEILLYDDSRFFSAIHDLEEIKLFKVTQWRIPDFKNNGELLPAYINPKGIWQITYDVFVGIIELPFILYKEKKYKKEAKV